MANFVIVLDNKKASTERFSITGDANVAFRVYTDSLCKNEVSRGSFVNPATVHIRISDKRRTFSQPIQLFVRNEWRYPITKIRAQVLSSGKPAPIAIAPDCSGRPKEFRFFGQAVIVFEGVLMPTQIVPFWLLGVKEPTDEEGIYDLVLVVDVETAV